MNNKAKTLFLILAIAFIFSSCTQESECQILTPIVPTSPLTPTPAPGPTSFPGRIVVRPMQSFRLFEFYVNSDGEIVAEEIIYPLSSLQKAANCFVLSPDGNRIITEIDGSLQIYEIQTQTLALVNEPGFTQCGIWSPDNIRMVYRNSVDNDVHLYNTVTGQDIVIFKVPQAKYGETSLDPWLTLRGAVDFFGDVWIDSNQVLFQAYTGEMPSVYVSSQTDLSSNTSILINIGDMISVDQLQKGWNALDSCRDGSYVLLSKFIDDDPVGQYLTKGFGSFAEIEPIEIPLARSFSKYHPYGFLDESCTLYFVKTNNNQADPLYFYFLDPITMRETRGPEWLGNSGDFFSWITDPKQGLAVVENGELLLLNLNTGGETCLYSPNRNCLLQLGPIPKLPGLELSSDSDAWYIEDVYVFP